MNLTDLNYILPEIALFGVAMVVLALSFKARQMRSLGLVSFLGVGLALNLLPRSTMMAGSFFSGLLVNDGLTAFFRFLSLIIAGLVIVLSMDYNETDEEDRGEYFFFILTITLTMMVAAASQNLMMIYITLEAMSLLSYIMAGYLRRDAFSSEAGLKYFLFGAAATGVTLYGISLLYGLFGTLDLSLIGQSLAAGEHLAPPAIILLSCLFVFVGFGFKCSLVPFHMWTPDVYEGAPSPMAAFFSVGPKAIGFVFILRLLGTMVQAGIDFPWTLLLTIIAAVTITLGNVVALSQNNIKRLLAYSTIAQAGYILIGLAVATTTGVQAVLFYLFVYALTNLGAFGVIIVTSTISKRGAIEDLAGLYKRAPFFAVVLAASLLSLAGIPPMAGFMAKFLVFAAAIQQGMFALVVIAALNSVIALYYYVQIIKVAFLHEPQDNTAVSASSSANLALGLILILILVLGLWPQPLLNFLTQLLQHL